VLTGVYNCTREYIENIPIHHIQHWFDVTEEEWKQIINEYFERKENEQSNLSGSGSGEVQRSDMGCDETANEGGAENSRRAEPRQFI
jgi:hypothetical protein